jgi:hypothetical protein
MVQALGWTVPLISIMILFEEISFLKLFQLCSEDIEFLIITVQTLILSFKPLQWIGCSLFILVKKL